MRRTWMPCVAVVAWLMMAATAWSDGLFLDGVSPRSLSRGGTNQGYADNGAILFDNPAAMSNVEGDGLFEADLVGLQTNFRYTSAVKSAVSQGFTPLPQLSYIRRSADGDFAIGIGMFTPAGFSTNYNMNGNTFFPGTRSYDSFGTLTKILPGISYKVTDRLSIGGTFGVGVSYASLNGPYFLQSAPLAGTPILLDIHGAGATQVWSAGMQYLLTEDTTIGCTYQSASNFNLHGTAQVNLPAALGGGISTYNSTVAISWPQTVALGVRRKLCPHRTVSADVIWFDWAQSFKNLGVTLQNASNVAFPPAINETLPLNWASSVSMRLGYEQILDVGGTFRIGYVYHPNPVPTGTLTPFLPATLTNTFTVGYGFGWKEWNVDVGWAHAFSAPQNIGTSQLVGGDFSNSTIRTQVDALFIGLIRPF
ncbi:MAG TPA: outer membrane protein transport protein [Pirellulales bacterium]